MDFTEILTQGLISHSGTSMSYIIGAALTAIASFTVGNANFYIIFGCDENKPTYIRVMASVCDFIKCLIAVFIGFLFMPADGFGYIAAVFCLIGHALPVWTRRRCDGYAVEVFGVTALLNPIICVICLLIYFVTVSLSHYKSLGVIVAACLFPIGNAFLPFSLFSTYIGNIYSLVNYLLCKIAPIAIALTVAFMYKTSINRLIRGNEPKTDYKINKY